VGNAGDRGDGASGNAVNGVFNAMQSASSNTEKIIIVLRVSLIIFK